MSFIQEKVDVVGRGRAERGLRAGTPAPLGPTARRSRPSVDGWLVAALVVAANGALSAAVGVWALVAEWDLAMVPAIPLSLVFHWWIAFGAYRRSASSSNRDMTT